nr:Fic family protein [Dyadobacter jiangsuensis]
MAVIHHQFESIHPFYDGNGRTGRIINMLYLVKEGLLNIPVLYLSRYINQHKGDYYRLLQKVRTHNAWEEWILQTPLHENRFRNGRFGSIQNHCNTVSGSARSDRDSSQAEIREG